MSICSATTNLYCIHSNHLFSHPLCEEQSILKRIANVVFHILTLGIPLAIYRIISCCYSVTSSKNENGNLQTTGINSVHQNKSIKPYSVLGQKALEFARKKLEEHPETKPFPFEGPEKANQLVNQEVARLTTLYWDVAFKKFEDLMKKNKENPWSHQEIINAADACMKIAYAISNLTLDDLKSFTENLSLKGENRTYAKALTKQDSYQYRTYYYCTNVYHWLRGAITWSANPWRAEEEGWFYPRVPISPSHTTLFYQKGSIQNSWNRLYNEYCDRVRMYVNEKELESADNRHFNWTKKDTGVKTFSSIPDTQPT